jgi:predicted nuclease of predicted toxin-antitoxin system
MIYLIDNQLPVGLVGHLQGHGLDAVHVSQRDLDRATDNEIWEYAKVNSCVIVSKDDDFFHLSGSDTNGPPLVWVRLGNCRNPILFSAFDFVLPGLVQALNEGAKVVEIR